MSPALVLVVLVHAVVAIAQDEMPVEPTARAASLYKEGLQSYKQQDFEQAAAALSLSYGLVPATETLFAWAQAKRMAGRCAEAGPLFERFIATRPPQRQIEAAQLAMRRCVDRGNAPKAQGSDLSAAAKPPQENRWYADFLGGVLCGVGATATIVGIALIVSAHGRAEFAEAAPSLERAQIVRAQAERRWAWGIGLSLAGVASLSGGIGRYIWVSRSEQETAVAVGGRF